MTVLGQIAAERLTGVPYYRPGRTPTGPPSGKLSSNEAPLGASPAIRAAIEAAARGSHRYPDEAAVRQQLADSLGVDASELIITNGSDELCYLIATVFLGEGRTAIIGDPCYQIDATVSAISGAGLVRVPLRSGAHDLPEMARLAGDADVVWLPSPHNPTGVACLPSQLEDFLAQVPESCMVVLDEAYRAFADPTHRADTVRLLRTFPNLLVQRTLSKDWALAGLRVGYGLGAADVIEALGRTRPPFSVNRMALSAVQATFGEDAWRSMSVARVREGRALLEAELESLGIEYLPSQANFVAARIPFSVLEPHLDEAQLSVRPGEDLGLPGWVRISIGWAPAMTTLRDVLRRAAPAHATKESS
jgi:histidinol-phosphate aminotransferase